MRSFRLLMLWAVSFCAAAFAPPLSSLSGSESEPAQALVRLPSVRVLTASDREIYLDAFDLEHEGRYEEADATAARAGNPLLIGTLHAERYLSMRYKPRYNELADWLAHFSDQPQAPAIYRMALAHKPAGSESLPEPVTDTRPLTGFSNGTERSVLHDMGGDWAAGLAAYRKGDMSAAAVHFRKLSDHPGDLPAGDRAAVAFWAYRALSATGDSNDAGIYATRAAEQPMGFYSLLARHVTGADTKTAASAGQQILSIEPLLGNTAVRRAIALKEIAQDTLAEAELRSLFPTSEEPDRRRLITLASLIDLPAAQMRMALEYTRHNDTAGDTLYPMPHWEPVTGYHIEPALLFAIMRQESGFNPAAHNPSGASGVMQLMPATATAMARALGVQTHNTTPAVSMTLGQGYLERLMDTSLIKDNLVFLVAAYNAGPGNVENWKRSLRYNNDPLLFIESVPYGETREYTQHVLGSYWVYSQLLGVQDAPSLGALAEGHWPHYEGTDEQLASMVNRLGAD